MCVCVCVCVCEYSAPLPSLFTTTMPCTPLWLLMRFNVSSTSDCTPTRATGSGGGPASLFLPALYSSPKNATPPPTILPWRALVLQEQDVRPPHTQKRRSSRKETAALPRRGAQGTVCPRWEQDVHHLGMHFFKTGSRVWGAAAGG